MTEKYPQFCKIQSAKSYGPSLVECNRVTIVCKLADSPCTPLLLFFQQHKAHHVEIFPKLPDIFLETTTNVAHIGGKQLT